MRELAAIVADLEESLGRCTASPEPLEGGITNRNFRVGFEHIEAVIRLTGRDTELLGISRDAEWRASACAAELGIAPAVLAGGDGYLVTEYLDARPAHEKELDDDPAGAARALRVFHESEIDLPARFWVPDLVDAYAAIVAERGGALPDGYSAMQALARRIEAALPLVDPVPCHDDLLTGNVLIADAGVYLVDWEYAGMGHRFFDLGNLAVNHVFSETGEERLLEAYLGAAPSPAERAALKLMKIMSDVRESAWGVVQGVLSELDFDFAQYAVHHHARLIAATEDPRLEEWLEDAAAA